MIEVYDYDAGHAPLLVSVPHDGRHMPPEVQARMTAAGRALPDTDWHVAELYAFARALGAHVLVANYSRYVVDLNRSPQDDNLYPGQLATGLCPEYTFAGDAIYGDGGVGTDEVGRRVRSYWQPYHDRLHAALAAIRDEHGRAVLWDAHSIASAVPRLFDGELPVLNIGTNGGTSCDKAFEDAVGAIAADSPFSHVVNGRFRGGYITRHYGRPADGIHAIQLEIAQRAYMDEATASYDAARAAPLQSVLQHMLAACLRETTR